MTSTPTTAAAEQPDQSRPSAVGGPGLLAVDGHELELPRTPATDGADGLGVSKLLGSSTIRPPWPACTCGSGGPSR